MADNIKFVQTESTQLYGAGASLGATSVQLTSLTDLLGATLAMTDFGIKGYGTIEPGTTGQEEAITFTGVTQNADGSATLTGVSNVLGKAPYTETSGLKITHAGGTTFVISNTAAFYNDLTGKNNDETITGIYTFTSPNYPQMDVTTSPPTASNQLATKAYVDSVAIAGAPQATNTVYGISKLSVAAVSATQPIVVGDNDTRVPTQNENDALVGTSGTAPSSSNKFVDNADTRLVGLPVSNVIKFGGSGADGALTITSGTTTIDCASASVVVKNYTSISITGTASLAFSNPNANGTIVILRSQGVVTITTSTNPAIDLRNLGATGGTGVTGNAGGSSSSSYGSGSGGASVFTSASGAGAFTTNGTITYGGNGGSVITIYGNTITGGVNSGSATSGNSVGGGTTLTSSFATYLKYGIAPGSGGSAGSLFQNGSYTTGNGGRGAGALYIQCGGALNITSTINASGTAGTAGSNSGYSDGGGGGGGAIVIFYNSLVANSGTYTVTGGAKGGTQATAGANGYSLIALNTEFA